jgi:hypothetical protein
MPPTDPQGAATVDRRTFLRRVGVGPQNDGAWTNAAFHDLARQIEREAHDSKRNGWMAS